MGLEEKHSWRLSIALGLLLAVVSFLSLFVGVMDMTPGELFAGNAEQFELFLISRLPRLLAILCTGMGMSVAGLIMQQLCMNKFVSPTTGATLASARFGILLALLFMPGSTIMGRALFSFIFAVLGTWIFVWFIQRIQFKDTVMVPLVGIMFGNIIGGVTSFLAYLYEMTQALSSWEVGHFSMVLRGRYEIVYLVVPLLVNSLIAGAIWTERWLSQTPEQTQKRRDQYPAGRESAPEDIASALYFLCSDQSPTITGTELTVDSGISICLLPYNKHWNDKGQAV